MSRYKHKKHYTWNAPLAYCIGLIASDGSLSKSGRHIDFTTTDYQLAELYRSIIKPTASIGIKKSGAQNQSFRVQVSDTGLYDFLLSTNLTAHKSHTIDKLSIPSAYYRDFLRGVFDGDGSCYSYIDPRWKKSFMYYLTITSASKNFLVWLQEANQQLSGASPGSLTQKSIAARACRLSYGKKDTRLLYAFMYYHKDVPHLRRKKEKLDSFFAQEVCS